MFQFMELFMAQDIFEDNRSISGQLVELNSRVWSEKEKVKEEEPAKATVIPRASPLADREGGICFTKIIQPVTEQIN